MSRIALFELSLVVATTVSVGFCACAFWLWRRWRFPFLLLFAFGALLDIFISLAHLAAVRNPLFDAEYGALMDALNVLFIISSLIFATGLAFLMRHIRRAAPPPSPISLEVDRTV